MAGDKVWWIAGWLMLHNAIVHTYTLAMPREEIAGKCSCNMLRTRAELHKRNGKYMFDCSVF